MNENSQFYKLNNLSLTFYGFQLRNSLNKGEKTVSEANKLWAQLIKLGNRLNIPELKTLTSQLICYENSQYKPELEDRQHQKVFSLLHHQIEGLPLTIPDLHGLAISGFLCPYRLHDSYFIDFTLSPKNSITPQELKFLNFSSQLEPSLGQTLVLYAEITEAIDSYLTIANRCINQLFSQKNDLELIGKSSLLNCPIFAYENAEIDPSKHHHILIWLNPYSDVPEQIDQANDYLQYLFWSRHKILYAYHQSRISFNNIQESHTEIEQQINNFNNIAQSNNRLEEFKQLLIELPQKSLQYSQLLRELSDHVNTIRDNEQNYCELISKIEKLPDSDSNFLQPFFNQINDKFKPQIESDLNFFSPTNSLFEELINGIRGIVAIDQIESDRAFQLELQSRQQKFQEALFEQERRFEEALQNRKNEFDETLQQKERQWQKELQTQKELREKQLRQQEEKNQQREKTIEQWIAFFGTGLAVSGISAGVINDPGKTIVKILSINPPPLCKNDDLVKFLCSNSFDIVFHIIVGLIFAIPVAISIGLIQKYTPQAEDNSEHSAE